MSWCSYGINKVNSKGQDISVIYSIYYGIGMSFSPKTCSVVEKAGLPPDGALAANIGDPVKTNMR